MTPDMRRVIIMDLTRKPGPAITAAMTPLVTGIHQAQWKYPDNPDTIIAMIRTQPAIIVAHILCP
jgi:hypothetical protein